MESVHFQYRVVNMAGLEADDYLAMNLPFAAAFASGMRPSKEGKAVQKFRAMGIIAQSGESEYRKGLLAHFVELNSGLNAGEMVEYERLLREIKGEEIGAMMTIFEQRGHEKGRQQEGREVLLMLLSNKFGELPAGWSERVQAVQDPEVLRRLILRAATINSLDEMELPN